MRAKPGDYSIELRGKEIPYCIRGSSKSKHLKLHISMENGLEVVLPKRGIIFHSSVEKFIFEKQAWVLRNMKKIELVLEESDSRKHKLLFLGREAEIKIVESNRKTAKAKPENGLLIVRVPVGKTSLAGKAITAFYKKQAREIIEKIVLEKSAVMGLRAKRVSIRDQSTRWGSCSSSGTLSFSWRLVAAPRAVIEYLVVHELAHVKHRNHSKRFYSEVERFCPLYRQSEEWLRKKKQFLRARTSF